MSPTPHEGNTLVWAWGGSAKAPDLQCPACSACLPEQMSLLLFTSLKPSADSIQTGHQPSSPEGKWDECLRHEVLWPPAPRYHSNPPCTGTASCQLPACHAGTCLHLGAEKLAQGRGGCTCQPCTTARAQWGHTWKISPDRAGSELAPVLALGGGWLQQPVAVGLTGSPFSSLASAVTRFAPPLWFLGGRGCLCSPAQPPCTPSLSTLRHGAQFYPQPPPNLRAGRHSFARNESETVQRTNSLPP